MPRAPSALWWASFPGTSRAKGCTEPKDRSSGRARATPRKFSALCEKAGKSMGSNTDVAMPSSPISRLKFGAEWVVRIPEAVREPSVRSRRCRQVRRAQVLVGVDIQIEGRLERLVVARWPGRSLEVELHRPEESEGQVGVNVHHRADVVGSRTASLPSLSSNHGSCVSSLVLGKGPDWHMPYLFTMSQPPTTSSRP